MTRRPNPYLIGVLAGALIGLWFAAASTHDFAQHLDRQVHSLSCSFVPGLAEAEAGPSGCGTTMMSAWSSVLRTAVWGGLPISLPAMGVFAFLAFFAVELWLSRRHADRRATGFLALATALPALTSIVMAAISFGALDAVCKLCIGIYLGSAVAFASGLLAWRWARRPEGAGEVAVADAARGEGPSWSSRAADPAPPDRGGGLAGDPAFLGGGPSSLGADRATARDPGPPPARRAAWSPPPATSIGYLAAAAGLGVALVAAPSALYLAVAPDHARFVGACGRLPAPSDEYGVAVPFRPRPGGEPALEVLDPLCPACRAFEQRLSDSGLDAGLDRRVLLFPLDSTCNWMVDEATHPGACAVSEAVLCAGEDATAVIEWAFANQASITGATRARPAAAAELVAARFPELAACVGSPAARTRLNKSLRWAVKNQLQVLTPQLFVRGVALCPEDVDLGLDFALSRMLERARVGSLGAGGATPPAAPAPEIAAPAQPVPAAPPAARPPAAARADAGPAAGGDTGIGPATSAPPPPGADAAPAPAAPTAPPSEASPPAAPTAPAPAEAPTAPPSPADPAPADPAPAVPAAGGGP